MDVSNRIKRINRARDFINELSSAMLRNNATDRTDEIRSIVNNMNNSDLNWEKDVIGRYRSIYNDAMKNLEAHLNLWKNKK